MYYKNENAFKSSIKLGEKLMEMKIPSQDETVHAKIDLHAHIYNCDDDATLSSH